MGVAPEFEPDHDLLPLRSGGAKPEAFDRIAGRRRGRSGVGASGQDGQEHCEHTLSHRGLLDTHAGRSDELRRDTARAGSGFQDRTLKESFANL